MGYFFGDPIDLRILVEGDFFGARWTSCSYKWSYDRYQVAL